MHELKFARNVGNVVASVALSSDVNVTALELGILNHEVVQEVVEVIRDSVFTPAQLSKALDEAEACSERLINIHDIGIVIPRELVVLKLERIHNVLLVELKVEWAILGIQTKH